MTQAQNTSQGVVLSNAEMDGAITNSCIPELNLKGP